VRCRQHRQPDRRRDERSPEPETPPEAADDPEAETAATDWLALTVEAGDSATELTCPTSCPARISRAPGDGVALKTSPQSRRFTWPRAVPRAITSCPR